MPQTKKIIVLNESKGEAGVLTSEFLFDDLEQNVVDCFLGQEDGILNGAAYEQGQLLFLVKDYGTSFYIKIDSNGDLILSSEDAENYSIDSNGNLIYTKQDMTTVNLGFIKPIHSGSTPPSNTQMIWYDTNTNLHKYYKVATLTWTQLGL